MPRETFSFFILRANKWSEWNDNVKRGGFYRFGPTVPNQKRLRAAEPGAELLFDRRTGSGVEFFSAASLGSIQETTEGNKTVFRASLPETGFQDYTPPVSVTDSMRQIIEAVPRFNIQHAIRPMPQETFHRLRRLIDNRTR